MTKDHRPMTRKKKGTLIVIGGREERESPGKCSILKEVARCTHKSRGKLFVVTAATNLPEELAADYTRTFKSLGVPHVETLDIRTRDQAFDPAIVKKLSDACTIFFTGGDQLRITSQLGGTPLF